LFAGPIIAREIMTAPRPSRFYVARASYVGLLFILMWTAWQSLIGWNEITEVGVIAFFGKVLFRLFVLVQLALMLFFAPLAAATSIAHEKDRRTFVLLLMTDLRDVEIILGKLAASLLQVATLLLTGAPVFFLCMLLGGVSAGQVLDVLGITAAAGVAGGSLGLLVALGRDRTFQSLALTVLLLVLAIIGIEALGVALPGLTVFGIPLAQAFDPFRTVATVTDPPPAALAPLVRPSLVFIAGALGLATVLIATGIVMLRIWNPGKAEPREQREGEAVEGGEQLVEVEEVPEPVLASATAGSSWSRSAPAPAPGFGDRSSGGMLPEGPGDESDPSGATTGLHVPRRTHRRITRKAGSYRRPWTNPIIWRELMTRAYGTKPLVIKAAYFLAFLLGVAFYYASPEALSESWRPAKTLVPLAILSLVLINAQGVTALTSERDTGALDLLLVTELSPREFIYGKLYGVLYNAKEMVALPVLLTGWFTIIGAIPLESAIYIVIDFLLLAHFSAMLGLHAAITYTNSRTAVANSLGTIFFLLIGILICAGLIVMSDREFGRQLLSFLIFIGAGSVALFASLGMKNPSRAIAIVALLTPFVSFYAIISLLNRDILAAFLSCAGAYGFALASMLVPAVSDFDIALGRTSAIQG
jgi:hypothetical protein